MAVGRRWLAAALVAAGLAGAACAPGGDSGSTGGPPAGGRAGDAMSDAAFDKVRLDTFEPSEGTPKVEDDFTGIRIAMPAKVGVGDLDRLPLCGVWSFDGGTMAGLPPVEDSLVFLARNTATNETATGNFRVHEDPASPAEMKPGEGEAPAGARGDEPPLIEPEAATVRGYFNYDLARVWKVPARPGRWRLHLVLHDVQSNEVEFEVVK
jgi:hypothetical protein